MASFPRTEAEVIQLAQSIAAGLAAHADIFTAAPVTPEQILSRIGSVHGKQEAVNTRAAQLREATGEKKGEFRELENLMRSVLRWAESVTRMDDAKLKLLGWGAPRSPNGRDAPGQPLTLEVPAEGSNWVQLTWKDPVTGGKVAAYKVQRRQRPEGEWTDVGTAVETGIRLTSQDTGVEFEYRVLGLNKAGEGPVSNVVRVVL